MMYDQIRFNFVCRMAGAFFAGYGGMGLIVHSQSKYDFPSLIFGMFLLGLSWPRKRRL